MSQLKGKRALVTGGSGFIGSHLTRRLLKEGAGVRLNRVTAYKWLELASSQTADENIQGRASTVRRLMALEMTRAEVAEGQRLAVAWNPEPDTKPLS